VYAELAARARQALGAGHSVIIDAMFLREADRQAVADAVQGCGTPLQGFWLVAPDAVLVERLRQRRNDPSDADAAVLAQQRQRDPGRLSWPSLDAGDSGLRGKTLSLIR
jgi:predicted kinase